MCSKMHTSLYAELLAALLAFSGSGSGWRKKKKRQARYHNDKPLRLGVNSSQYRIY